MRNAALLGLMQPNLETGARQTGRYTLFGLTGGNFKEIGRFVWNLLAFARRGSVGGCWKVSSLLFFYSVQDSMERKSTKRRLNRPKDTEWLWTKGKGAFCINISRDHEFFFLSVVDSNTCDKIRTIRARITCNNARNLDLRYFKGY